MMDLMTAARRGTLEQLQEILLISTPASVNQADARGCVALHHAAKRGNPFVQSLLEANADVHARNKAGWTPFMFAIFHCKEASSFDTLARHGADCLLDNQPVLSDLTMYNEVAASWLQQHRETLTSARRSAVVALLMCCQSDKLEIEKDVAAEIGRFMLSVDICEYSRTVK